MVAYVWIGAYFETWWHVWIAAMIAPLMLLRTNTSTQLGWRIAEYLAKFWCERTLWQRLVLAIVATSFWIVYATITLPSYPATRLLIGLMGCYLILLGGWTAMVARLCGAFGGFFQAPVQSVRAIPANWWGLVACTDLHQSPALIPQPADIGPRKHSRYLLARDSADVVAWYDAWGIVRHLRQALARTSFSALVRWAMIVPLLVVAISHVVPAFAFRFSIKATALVWLPLIWAVQPPKPSGEPWSAHLKLKSRGDIPRIVVLISAITLILFAAKYLCWLGGNALVMHASAWDSLVGKQLGELIVAIVRPGGFPIWQVTAAVNAVLSIGLILAARHWFHRQDAELPIPEARIDRTFAIGLFFRRFLSSYAILNNGVVFYFLARELPIPPIGSQVFPWL